MASQKKPTKQATKKQDNIEEFIELAKDLKEIVVDLNQRMSQMETMFERIRTRLGL